MIGKIKRLLKSITPDQARPDDLWAREVLSAAEHQIYQQMDPRDREHGTRVARQLVQDHPTASAELVAAAVLHDCGKSIRPYHVLERVMVGLVPYRLSQLVPGEAVRVRFAHPELGAVLLEQAGARPRVVQLVRLHHHPEQDAEAALLYAYDHLE